MLERRANAIARLAAVAVTVGLAACQGGASFSGTPMTARSATLPRAHWAKTSIGKFADPYGVAVDAEGNVFIADPGAKSVWRITPRGAKKAIGNNWPGVAGPKFDPVGVSIAGNGFMAYVADKGGGIVWGVRTDESIARIAGPFTSPHYPRGTAYSVGSSTAYAALTTASPVSTRGSVRCISTNCPVLTVRELANPYGVAADDRGDVFVADAGAKEALRIDASGAQTIGRFADPYGIAVSPDGSTVYVADAGAKNVYQGTRDGSSWTEIGTFGDPYGVAVSAQGVVYVADPGSKDVWKLTP